jgi:MacB-like periplasmic core domain
VLSVLLLTAGSLMLRTYWNLQNLNPGFDRTHVLSFTLEIKDAGFTKTQTRAYMAELEQRVKQLPGVRSTAYADRGLMRGAGIKTTVTAQGTNLPNNTFLNTTFLAVTPAYFDALGIPLLAGRSLQTPDVQAKPQRVVINRALANLLFPHTSPIGKLIVSGTDGSKPPTIQVVGLVETAKFRRMQELAPPMFYEAMSEAEYQLVLYVRTMGNPSSVLRPVEEVIRKMGDGVPLTEVAPIEQEVQNTLWQERLVARLAGFFSLWRASDCMEFWPIQFPDASVNWGFAWLSAQEYFTSSKRSVAALPGQSESDWRWALAPRRLHCGLLAPSCLASSRSTRSLSEPPQWRFWFARFWRH